MRLLYYILGLRTLHGVTSSWGVLLVSEDVGDQVLVFTSRDEWLSAVFKGAVNNTAFRTGGQPTWTVQIGEESIFLREFFNYDVPKNWSSFPMIDITDLVEELVNV
jgi:hypothetical protein